MKTELLEEIHDYTTFSITTKHHLVPLLCGRKTEGVLRLLLSLSKSVFLGLLPISKYEQIIDTIAILFEREYN